VPKDDAEAAKWYRRAAEQGFATAQVNLGALYSRGGGVPKDLVEAYAWCLIGQARGEQKAAGLIASLETRMTPPEIAAGKKRAQAMIDERKRPR
jgi:TPR repeat protein